ncbi:hypothetical protein HZA75_03385 [Candidatus Roizmanbacteria bacterium]|nr:hypothetical protein [Candidatus Roizmanbacteria bacterium]
MLNIYKTTLSKKSQLNSNTYLYNFNLLEPREINFKAGQYLMIKIPTDKGPVSRLYSIASPNTNRNSLELIIGMVPGGLASNYLFSLKENTEVVFQGPAGMFGLKENNGPKIFLTTGTGIAPVKSMLESYQLPVSSYSLLWGLKTYKDIYLFDELKEFNLKICLSREQNLDMIPEVDKKFFELGHVDSCFEKQFNNGTMKQLNNYDFYLCGGRNIIESLRQFLVAKNVPKENIYFEKF